MMHGDPGAKMQNIRPRKDVVVEPAKAKTSPRAKVRKNVKSKEQIKAHNVEKVRTVTGPRCDGMAKVRAERIVECAGRSSKYYRFR